MTQISSPITTTNGWNKEMPYYHHHHPCHHHHPHRGGRSMVAAGRCIRFKNRVFLCIYPRRRIEGYHLSSLSSWSWMWLCSSSPCTSTIAPRTLWMASALPSFFIVSHSNDTCLAKFLGRFSFQPFSENPLLGPSSHAWVSLSHICLVYLSSYLSVCLSVCLHLF